MPAVGLLPMFLRAVMKRFALAMQQPSFVFSMVDHLDKLLVALCSQLRQEGMDLLCAALGGGPAQHAARSHISVGDLCQSTQLPCR